MALRISIDFSKSLFSELSLSIPFQILSCSVSLQFKMVWLQFQAPVKIQHSFITYYLSFFFFSGRIFLMFFFAHWIKSKLYINIRVINLSIFSLFKWVGILCSFCGPWAVFLVLQQNLLVELGQKHLFQVTEVLMRPLHLLQANLGLYHWSQ